MSISPHCLDNIIGLSQTTCSCFTSGMPIDAKTSNSKIYLDQLEGMNLNIADSIADCEQGGLWDLMDKARLNGITAFKADLMALLFTKYKQRRQPFAGVIGSPTFTKNLDLTNGYYGIKLFAQNIIGGNLQLKRIGLLFDSAATFNVYIYDNLYDSPVATYSVTSTANALTWFTLPAPLNLPMNNYGNDNPRYYIVYQKAAFKPKDNQAGCGCSHAVYKYYWNENNPSFKSYEKDRWSEFVMQTGVSGDSTLNADRESWGTANYMYGLILDVEFKCRVQDIICDRDIDFESNPIALAMAYAIRYKAGELMVDSILASGQINRFTMTDRERLMGKKNTYVKEYKARIDWISDNINYRSNDCLTCSDTDDLFQAGIFS